jgi:phosphoribosylamine--glycine ligase / phosphoribosylformylglycinamidine cyclo-ligase
MVLRILLLGSGGREHCLAWKLSQSNIVNHIFVCPGNGGTFRGHKITNVDISLSDFPRLVEFAVQNQVRKWTTRKFFSLSDPYSRKVNLLVPGPEQPLVDGVELFFRKGRPRFNDPCILIHPNVHASWDSSIWSQRAGREDGRI